MASRRAIRYLQFRNAGIERNGFLSHGATVARQYGIPAVVNIAGIVAELDDGGRVRVDGDAGTVARPGGK